MGRSLCLPISQLKGGGLSPYPKERGFQPEVLMEKVTLYLSDKLHDPETNKQLQMWGVELRGTSTQIGLIWECLRRFGEIDVTHHSEIETLRKCEAALKKARETADEFELNDPDQK